MAYEPIIDKIVQTKPDGTVVRFIKGFINSDDPKPVTGIYDRSELYERDTGKWYLFNQSKGEWIVPDDTTGGGSGGGSGDVAADKVVASAYSTSGAYTAGSYVTKGGKLYKAKQTVSNEPWTAAHWEETKIMNEVSSIEPGTVLPDPSTGTNGMVVSVNNGEYVLADAPQGGGDSELPDPSQATEGDVLTVHNGEWIASEPQGGGSGGSDLPDATQATEGDVLTVHNGEWIASEPQGGSGESELPDATQSTEGNVLTVHNGEWIAAAPQGGSGTGTVIPDPASAADDMVLAVSNGGYVLKNQENSKFPIIAGETEFFDYVNYGAPEYVEFKGGLTVSNSGSVNGSSTANSILFNYIEPNTTYYFYAPLGNRCNVIESSGDITRGNSYTLLTKTSYSYINSTLGYKFTTGETAKKVMIFFYTGGEYDYETYKDQILLTKGDLYANNYPYIKKSITPYSEINPSDTTFFDYTNHFHPESALMFNDRGMGSTGSISNPSGGGSFIIVPVEPNTKYWFNAPSMNRGCVVENETQYIQPGNTYTVLTYASVSGPFSFITGPTAKYAGIYFKTGTYDYAANMNSIVLNKDVYTGLDSTPRFSLRYLPDTISSPIKDANILIFGDSITDSCSFSIDSENRTSSYSWRQPSSDYTDNDGILVEYSMWPKILKESEPCGEIRNYAKVGASYKTLPRTGNDADPRQNLQYQIDVALNDIDNPNNAFEVSHFVPDIVIFALGTNDGAPSSNDTYEAAMSATVYDATYTTTIDVDGTISALDDSKTIQSARKAFLRIKKEFPLAQIYCVLPIQRGANETNVGNLHDYLKHIAQRYGCIIIDGAFESGITREFNGGNVVGAYFKADALHPNKYGQNLMARMIIASLKSHYMSFGGAFNS